MCRKTWEEGHLRDILISVHQLYFSFSCRRNYNSKIMDDSSQRKIRNVLSVCSRTGVPWAELDPDRREAVASLVKRFLQVCVNSISQFGKARKVKMGSSFRWCLVTRRPRCWMTFCRKATRMLCLTSTTRQEKKGCYNSTTSSQSRMPWSRGVIGAKLPRQVLLMPNLKPHYF